MLLVRLAARLSSSPHWEELCKQGYPRRASQTVSSGTLLSFVTGRVAEAPSIAVDPRPIPQEPAQVRKSPP